MTSAHIIKLKRAYEPPSPDDGTRILVDRLWPRGVKRESAAIEVWMKEMAPSADLRTWFGHEPARWAEFQDRYRRELAEEPAMAMLEELLAHVRRGPVTLVYAARDDARNNAVVIRAVIEERLAAE